MAKGNQQILKFRVNIDPQSPDRGVVHGPGLPHLKAGDIGQTDQWFTNWVIRHMENAGRVTVITPKEGK